MAKEERDPNAELPNYARDASTPAQRLSAEAIPANADMAEISTMAQQIANLETEKEQLKMRNEEIARELWRLTTNALPGKMTELGLSSFKLEDGSEITLGTAVSCTWPKEGELHKQAVDWMNGHGFGDLIKDTVAVLFGKGEISRANELIDLLDQGGFTNWSRKEEVHFQTLKAWIKECVEKGVDIPFELFSAEVFTQAKLKLPRVK